MAGTQTPIVYPESILGWFLLSSIAVSSRDTRLAFQAND
jgi:hypothetical protein